MITAWLLVLAIGIGGQLLASFVEKKIRAYVAGLRADGIDEARITPWVTRVVGLLLILRFGSVLLALYYVPWRLLGENADSVIVGGSLVFGLIVARLEDVIAGVTGGFSLAHYGEVVQVNGDIFTISYKTLNRVYGYTPDGKQISVPFSDMVHGSFINWTRTEFARSIVRIHVADQLTSLDHVYAAIHAVIMPDGVPDPDYSCLESDPPKHAWCSYAGQGENSHLFEIYIYQRYVTQLPRAELRLHDAVFRECQARGIALGQQAEFILKDS